MDLPGFIDYSGPMDVSQIICAVLIVLAGGFLQGTVAFGFGLLSVPLLLMVGLPMPTVLAISAVCTAFQSGNGIHHLSHAVPWKIVAYSVAVRSLTMILGVWVLSILVHHPVSLIKFWVGLVMLVMVILQAAWKPAPRARLHNGWNLAAFGVSGFTGGLCSMGGPPLVLWVMAHDWTAEKTRAFLFATFATLVPIQLALLYWTFGHDVVRGMILGTALSPVVLLGSYFGLRFGGRFSKPFLVRVAFLLLAGIALNAMFPFIWKLLRPPA
jgi:uncharacterized membrane protein YfcA